MTPSQIARIDAAYEKMFDVLANDNVTYVSPTGVQTDLICILYNLKLENKPGLIVDSGGIRDQVELEMLHSKKRVAAKGVTVDVTGHWIIDGLRYDFADREELQKYLNPVGGLQNLLAVRVRESAEINQAAPAAQWGFDTT